MKKKLLLFLIINIISVISFSQELDLDRYQITEFSGDYFGCKLPNLYPEAFNSKILQVSSENGLPHCLVFSNSLDQAAFVIIDQGRWTGKVMYTRRVNNKWIEPIALPIDENHCNTDPFFSSDGQKLYYTVYKTKESNSPDFYYVETKELNNPIRLPHPINTDSIEWTLSISHNNELFFSSSRAGGKGKTDIYTSKIRNGKFTIPQNIQKINSIDDDDGAIQSPDENYLLFNRLNTENQKFELFVTFKDTSNKCWLPPVKLSSEINNGDFNYRPFITFDGKYLFFNRRKGDEVRIYWVKTEIITAGKIKTTTNRAGCR